MTTTRLSKMFLEECFWAAFNVGYPFKDVERVTCVEVYSALVEYDVDKARAIADKTFFTKNLLAKLEEEAKCQKG